MVTIDDPRSAWTSHVPVGRTRIAPSTRRGVRWHWSGNPTNRSAASLHSSCLTLVAAWERYHMSKGWNSIGYNLLICPHARVIEGRGVDYRGAHSGSTDDNALTYGVQLMVGTGELANAAMFDRATRLERELWEHSGRTLFSSGHRDAPGASTACPGEQIYAWAHQPHSLTTTTPPSPEEDDMPYTVDQLRAIVQSELEEYNTRFWASPTGTGTVLRNQIAAILANQDPDTLASAVSAAVVAALPPSTGDLTAEELTAATAAGVRQALGTLDNPPTP